MKIDSSGFDELVRLRQRLGAAESHHSYSKVLDPLEEITIELATAGIEVALSDIQEVGGLLTYKGDVLAILYIYASNSGEEALVNNAASSSGTPKFHIAWCRTLDNMTRNNRFERYVLSRKPSEYFDIEAHERDPEIARLKGERHKVDDVRLYPCKNCMDLLSYKGYSRKWSTDAKNDSVEDFRIKNFLDENDGNLTVMRHLPATDAANAPSGAYTAYFPEISRSTREKAEWKCSKCAIDMTDRKDGLHVHHINGVKSDNSPTNLKVLCALCHKSVDSFHKTMYVKPEIERYIERNRP